MQVGRTGKNQRVLFVPLVFLAFLSFALPSKVWPQAWKAEWEKTVAAAKKEGKLLLAGPPGQFYRDALMAFRKAYPDIQVEYVGIQGRDYAPRILQERRAGHFLWDVHVGGAGTPFLLLLPQGVLEPLQPALTLPEVLDDGKWHNGFKDGWMEQEGKYIYGFCGYLSHGVFVNRDLILETQLEKGEDLWNAKWKGKIVWHDPRAGGNGSNQATLILVNYGEDALGRLLKNQGIVVTADYRQQLEWVAQGRYPIGIGIIESNLRAFQKEGVANNVKPFNDVKLSSAVSGFGNAMLINRAPHPNAARVYLNWLLSREGQSAWAMISGDNSRRLDVPAGDAAATLKPGVTYLNLQKQDYLEKRKVVFSIAKEALQ